MNINLAKIEGGLTTLMNNHLRAASKGNVPSKIFAEQLEDLLEMVIDMQGTEKDKEPITVVLNNNEIDKKKIEELKNDNYMWQNTCNMLRARLEDMRGVR